MKKTVALIIIVGLIFFSGCAQTGFRLKGGQSSDPFVKIRASKLRKTILKLKERRIRLEACTEKLQAAIKADKKKLNLCSRPAPVVIRKASPTIPFLVGFVVGGVAVGLTTGLIVYAIHK